MVFTLRQTLCSWLHQHLGHPRWSKKVEEALTTEDLWRLFRARVPPVVSEYFRGGADREITLRANSLAWQEALTTAFGAQRFDEVHDVDTSTSFVGFNFKVPWMISPVGSLALLYPKADALAAQVAGEFGTAMTLSTLSGTPMEEVAQASSHPCFFQLYLCYGRDASIARIERAKRAGFKALVLTIDTARAGNRLEHARMKPVQAMTSLRGNLRVAPQMIVRPSWLCSHYAGGGMINFVNVEDAQGKPMPYTDIGAQLASSAVTWEDFSWIREAWFSDNLGAKLIVKGVHCAEDAKRAEDEGAHAVCWSNHGGRQQDRVPSTLQMVIEEMPKMKSSKMDFMADGGIRDGSSLLIGLSYGLKSLGLGRVAIAGLGAGGAEGLRRAGTIINAQLENAMRLVGMRTVAEIQERGEELRRTHLFKSTAHLAEFVY